MLDICGKPEKSWSVKSFADVVELPYNFTHEGHKFTLRKSLDDEGEESENIELVIDGIPYKKHPYISQDFVVDEEKQQIYCAGL